MQRRRREYTSPEEWFREPGDLVWRRVFAGTRDQVGIARGFVKTLLFGTGREDEAALIISELATNAIVHTRSGQPNGWFGVELVLSNIVHLAVTDLGGGGSPCLTPQASSDLKPGGWGLGLVQELSDSIGIHGSPQNGHTIWSDLDLTAKSAEPGSFVQGETLAR